MFITLINMTINSLYFQPILARNIKISDLHTLRQYYLLPLEIRENIIRIKTQLIIEL